MSILKRKTSYKKIIEKVITRLLSRKGVKKTSEVQGPEPQELGQELIIEQDDNNDSLPPMIIARARRNMMLSRFSSENSLTSTLFLPDEEDAWSDEDDSEVYITFPERNWMDVRY